MVITQSRIQDMEWTDTEQLDLEIDERCVPTAELAECTCPEFCERDHDND
jgi:hypothetical protein